MNIFFVASHSEVFHCTQTKHPVNLEATQYMTRNKDWIQEYKDSYNHTVTVANNSTLETMGSGQVSTSC